MAETPFTDSAIIGEPPSDRWVAWTHRRAEVGPEELHHRLGFGPNDAAPGNHNHNGVSSLPLFDINAIPADLPATPTDAQVRDAIDAISRALRTVAGAISPNA